MNRAPANTFFSDRPEAPVMDEGNSFVNSENSPLMADARNNDNDNDDDECTTDNCRDRCNDPFMKGLCVVGSSAAGLILGLKIGALTIPTYSCCLGVAGCYSACWTSFFAVGGREACEIFACPSPINRVPPSMLEPNNSLSR